MMKRNTKNKKGFTLIETMVAITLITVAIVAPMALASQSLASAYYARDEVTAENLAQEGIEAVRSVRDGNILLTAEGTPTDLFQGIPLNTPFIIDAHTIPVTLTSCASNPCSISQSTLETDGELYGYNSGWTNTNFQRVASTTVIFSDSGGHAQEIQISVTVSWQSGSFQKRSFTLFENFYRWVNDGSGSTT